jgi:DNA-binding NtrC family response regulator
MDANEPGQPPGRILLVDDDPALGGYLTRVLRKRGGFDVTHQLDSAAALRCLEAEPWDLLITDVQLPGMTGLELLERVRQMHPDLPVAVLTGNPATDYAGWALPSPAAEFMQKPITADDLVAKATELVEAGRAGRPAAVPPVSPRPRTPLPSWRSKLVSGSGWPPAPGSPWYWPRSR